MKINENVSTFCGLHIQWNKCVGFLPPPACQSGRRVHSESSPTPALCTGMPDWWNPRCLQIRCCGETKTRETQFNIFHSPSLGRQLPLYCSPRLWYLYSWPGEAPDRHVLPEGARGVTSHFFAPASNELSQEGAAQGSFNSNWIQLNLSLMMHLLLMSHSGLQTPRCGHLSNPRYELFGPVSLAGWLVWSFLWGGGLNKRDKNNY